MTRARDGDAPAVITDRVRCESGAEQAQVIGRVVWFARRL